MAKKRTPPQVIFWPEDGTLWAWNSFPLDPRLRRIFDQILSHIGNRGHMTVTITRIDRPQRKLLRGQTLEALCTAFDFYVGGLTKGDTRALLGCINDRSIDGGQRSGSGSPEVVLHTRKEKRGVHFRIEFLHSPQALVSPPEEVTG